MLKVYIATNKVVNCIKYGVRLYITQWRFDSSTSHFGVNEPDSINRILDTLWWSAKGLRSSPYRSKARQRISWSLCVEEAIKAVDPYRIGILSGG